jgi:hypothetical protein
VTVDLKQDTLTGIHAAYRDGPYDVGLRGIPCFSTWCACLATARHRTSAPRPDGPTPSDLTYPSHCGIRSSADPAAGCRPVRRTARGFSLLGEALTNAFTQLAGTELSSRTDFRNKVAEIASKAPRVPTMYAQKISETKATVALMPSASPVNRG